MDHVLTTIKQRLQRIGGVSMKTRYLSVKHKELVSGKYPNFHVSGSIAGMKRMFYGENAMLVRCGQWIYNVPKEIYDMAK